MIFLEALSDSIELAIVENKPITLMGDYNVDYLNEREQNCLDTVILPYGLRIQNTNIPTRVKDDSKTLIDYIIIDLNNSEKFSNIISDTPLRTQKNKLVDHFATTTITDIKIKRHTNVTIKKIFDKTNYSKEFFQHAVAYSDWGNFYNQTCAEGMFTIFVNIIETALKKSVPKKKVFIRNDKSDITFHQKWKNKTRKLYREMNRRMKPTDERYEVLQRKYLEQLNHDRIDHLQQTFSKLETEKVKRSFINEVRNSKRTKTERDTLQNSFGDIIMDQKQIANFLNYRFSKLGDYLGNSSINEKLPEIHFNDEIFIFQPISLFTCKKFLKELNIRKPLGPSNIPTWALNDCTDILAEPLCFLINAFFTEGIFPEHFEQAHVTPIFKKGNSEDPNNYRPISITCALSKIFEKVLNKQLHQFFNS